MFRKKRPITKKKIKEFKGLKSRYIILTLKTFAVFIVIILLAAVGILVFAGDFFKIKSISCQKNNFPCSEETEKIFFNAYGASIFLFNSQELAIKVKKNNPGFGKILIKKKLPDRLFIEIIPREEFAILKLGTVRQAVVDEEGFVFSDKAESLNLPIFLVNSLPGIGDSIADETILKGLKLINLLKNSYISFEYINYPDEDSLTILLSDNFIATVSAKKQLSSQVDSLQYILRHSKIEDKVIEGVDLRFQKPVVKFKSF